MSDFRDSYSKTLSDLADEYVRINHERDDSKAYASVRYEPSCLGYTLTISGGAADVSARIPDAVARWYQIPVVINHIKQARERARKHGELVSRAKRARRVRSDRRLARG